MARSGSEDRSTRHPGADDRRPPPRLSGRGSTSCVAALFAAALSLVALLPLGGSEPVTIRAQQLALLLPAGDEELSTFSYEVLERGAARAATPRDDALEIALYFDLPLARAETIEDTVAALRRELPRLTRLGAVEVVASESYPEVLAESTRDVEELEVALDEVEALSGAGGQLLDLRSQLLAPQARLRLTDGLDLHVEELSLLRWQREAFLEWLDAASSRNASTRPPRALILVQDGMDIRGPEVTLRALSDQDAVGDQIERVERLLSSSERDAYLGLTRTVAALGWTVFPTVGTPVPELEQSDELAREYAEATGGQNITATKIAELVDRLERRLVLAFEAAGDGSGDPYPLDVRLAERENAPRPAALPPPHVARRWNSVSTPHQLLASRAWRALEGGGDFDEDAGDASRLSMEAVVLDGATRAGKRSITLDVVVGQAPAGVESSVSLRATVVARGLDVDPVTITRLGSGVPVERGWHFLLPLEVPSDADEIALVVDDARTGVWGAAIVEASDRALSSRIEPETLSAAPSSSPPSVGAAPDVVAISRTSSGTSPSPPPSTNPPPTIAAPPADRERARSSPSQLLRILPPRDSVVVGDVEIRTLVSRGVIDRVEFYLDGNLVEEDTRRPFDAKLDFGAEPSPHRIEARGYDRSGTLLATDWLDVNAVGPSRGVRIRSADLATDGSVELVAELALDEGETLDRMELFRGNRLLVTLDRPPFRARLPGPGAPGADFVRVEATLRDGTKLEAVEILGAPGSVEVVDVNLVQVWAVVTDRDGQPVQGLELADFELRSSGERVDVTRFAVAEEVPLQVGIAVDSSQSMWSVMPDTRRAAAKFLGDVLTPIDRAFVVDFDDEVRLVNALSSDVLQLARGLQGLVANGGTALYDAMAFSLLQYQADRQRKALVVLTDGDDTNSQTGYRRLYDTVTRAGIPIYGIALGGFDGDRRSFRKMDLEAVAEASGAQVFYVSEMAEVTAAYDQISQELRSQYLLAFTTPKALTDSELRKIEVRLARRDLDVRFVVGRGS